MHQNMINIKGNESGSVCKIIVDLFVVSPLRRLALAEENTELTQTARLAQVFNSVCRQVMEYKGKERHIVFTLPNVNVKLAV